MAYEDYTTFTEVDPGNDITVTANKITFDAYDSYRSNYKRMYKSYGRNYFSDCTLQCQSVVTNITLNGGQGGTWLIIGLSAAKNQFAATTSAYGDISRIDPGIALYFKNASVDDTDLDVILSNRNLGNTDTFAAASVATLYYFTFEKTGSDCTVYIYDDAPRTNLIDTLAIVTDDYALEYLHPGGAVLQGFNPDSFLSGYSENLEIIAVTSNTQTPDTTANQDFDLYTEFDAGSEVQINSSSQIEAWDSRKIRNYVYENFGANHFDVIKHQVDSMCTNVFPQGGYVQGMTGFWGVSNDLGSCADGWTTGIYAYWLWYVADNSRLEIRIKDDSTGDDDTWVDAVAGYMYFMTVERSAGSNICTLKIYKDTARTILMDTLSISCTTDTYRYLYGQLNVYSNDGQFRPLIGAYIENLQLLELVAPTDPAQGGPTDYASNAEWPTTDLYVTIPSGQSNVTVYFYDDEDNLIGQVEGQGGQTVTVPWNDLDCEEEYGWYVVMDNGESVVTSSIWYFTCGLCDVFTIASESHPTIHLNPPRFRDGADWKVAKEIQRFGFWSENWAIHDNGVETEPLVLRGWEWIDESGDIYIFHRKFTDIHDIMNKHEEVAISGLGDCFDGYYYIKSFRFRTIKGAPRCREWTIQLEFSREKTW